MLVTLKIEKPELKEMIAAELRRRLGVELDDGDVDLDFNINGADDESVFASVVVTLPERGER